MTELATIFALSTAPGRAGIAVVRLSGGCTGSVLDRMTSRRPAPRHAGLRRIKHPLSGEVLDQGLVLWLPAPHSETGEDMAEFHVHGGPAVVRAILQALAVIDGCRLAEPGEFARRAFENGRMDLTQVEGLGDLIDAETDAQRRQALAQAGGALARLYDGWRERLLEAQALVEAAIDFSDEADVATDAIAGARMRAAALLGEIDGHLADGHRGEIVRDGFRIVLAGPPNVGKSSLLNALARRDAAIVSPEAGTTRDVIEVRLDLGGYAVSLTDTAGLRQSHGAVETEGIRRALERAARADLILWVIDAGAPVWDVPPELGHGGVPIMAVLNKTDLAIHDGSTSTPPGAGPVRISATTGEGIAELVGKIAGIVAERAGHGDGIVLTQERHRRAIVSASAATRRFLEGAQDAPELRAEDLRQASEALARVVGRIDVEEVLGQIFGRFCIGK